MLVRVTELLPAAPAAAAAAAAGAWSAVAPSACQPTSHPTPDAHVVVVDDDDDDDDEDDAGVLQTTPCHRTRPLTPHT